MMKKFTVVGLLAAAFGISTEAYAWTQSPRCDNDWADTTSATNRTNWARSRKTQTGDSTFLSNAANLEILNNPTYVLYPIYATFEGFTFRGPGPKYAYNGGLWNGKPTGGYIEGEGPIGSIYKAGTNGLVAATSIQNVSAAYKPSPGVYNEWVCEAGCYTPDQELRYEQGFVAIKDAVEMGLSDIVTLSSTATFDRLSFMKNEVETYTIDIKDVEQDIYVFTMRSGGQLKVTTEHPMVTEEGAVKRAADFVTREALVREDGSLDEIVDIKKISWFGKAYNLRPVTKDLVSNIVVAQGYLNGSVRYQSEFLKELNRIILRENIPADAIPIEERPDNETRTR